MDSLAWPIGLICVLKRREEPLVVPSLPAESINTGMASGATTALRMLPIKQLWLTFMPWCPIAMQLNASVIWEPAPAPIAMLKLPLVLVTRASRPIAMLDEPVVFKRSALAPSAVLWLPVLLFKRAVLP